MIYVVSGLPRSGTSLMMQMLTAGGLTPFTDGQRTPDADNPRGYFEYERVKQLKRDAAWVSAAEGQVIKVVSPLLQDLPDPFHYKVVFMLRRMEEILASQRAMMRRRGAAETGPDDARMARYFTEHLEQIRRWLAARAQMEVIYCDYNQLLAEPRPLVESIIRFIGQPLNAERMVASVDPNLHRQK